MRLPLNLARRRLRNERLPTLVLAVCFVLLGALSVRHALEAFELRPGSARDLDKEVIALENEIASATREAAELARLTAPEATVEEWTAIKDLVDRRLFSWTGLFAALEGALPPGVRLVSVSPTTREGQIVLTLSAVGRTVEDALALPTALNAQGEFLAVLDGYAPSGRGDGIDIKCSVRYLGSPRRPAAVGPDQPAAQAPLEAGSQPASAGGARSAGAGGRQSGGGGAAGGGTS